MQDKLVRLLKIKIDAINRNIDNLNYLNEELEKNNESLDYIKEKISLFADDNILNFDKIDKVDFERILFMVNPKVSEIFQDKTCNYQGIMYIIQGIRQGISLDLTGEQTNAILSFQEGMYEKEISLKEVINDLEESKERLPETDLNILTVDLEKYQDIVSKLDSNLYLTEIDDIVEVLDFSNALPEEKSEIFEYILKYNADIYSKQAPLVEEEKKEVSLNEITVPEFHYEPVNIEIEANKEKDSVLLDDNKIEVAPINLNDYETLQMPIIDDNQFDTPSFLKTGNENNQILDNETLDFNTSELSEMVQKPEETAKEIEVQDNQSQELEEVTPNTVDLEAIIQKIDAKLKEMEEQERNEQSEVVYQEPINLENEFDTSNAQTQLNPIQDINLDDFKLENEEPDNEDGIVEDVVNDTTLNEVLAKYGLETLLESINTQSKKIDVFELDNILSILNENKILEFLKEKTPILSSIITNNNKDKLNELITLVKENLVSKDTNHQYILDIITLSMPMLLIKSEVIDTFKANIDFYKEHQINLINLFDNYRELLIVENDILKANYEKIENYKLELNNDNVKYLLYNSQILENLDYYIEAFGYEKGFLGTKDEFDGVEYVNKHPYKLNSISQTALMKLRYSSENDMKIYGSKPGILAGEIANPKVDILVLPPEYKNLYFNHEYSFIDRSEMLLLLDELKENNSFDLTLDENLEKLDSLYKTSHLRYTINDIMFSRIKTIRLYNFLKGKGMNLKNALLIALTYNSVIKRDEYVGVESIINTLVEGGN